MILTARTNEWGVMVVVVVVGCMGGEVGDEDIPIDPILIDEYNTETNDDCWNMYLKKRMNPKKRMMQ